MNDGPIFITGTFRSGTTLVAQILRNHPNVELIWDSVNFFRFSYKRYDSLEDFNNVKALVEEIKDRIKKRWKFHFDSEAVLKNLEGKEVSYGLIYDTLMKELLLKDSSAKIWGEKTVLAWTKIPDFFEMFPNGRIIHIIRDPRAVLASWKKTTNAPGNDYLDSIFNCIDSMNKMEEYKKIFKDKKYFAIKYEDLVKDPERLVKELCEKLELEFNKNLLNTSTFTDKIGRRWEGNSMFDEHMKNISTSMINKWKEKLDKWEIFLSDFLVGDLMKEYNYEKENINPTEELLKKINNEIASSKLVMDGILKYLFTNQGIERFPTNPFDPKNWDPTKL